MVKLWKSLIDRTPFGPNCSLYPPAAVILLMTFQSILNTTEFY